MPLYMKVKFPMHSLALATHGNIIASFSLQIKFKLPGFLQHRSKNCNILAQKLFGLYRVRSMSR